VFTSIVFCLPATSIYPCIVLQISSLIGSLPNPYDLIWPIRSRIPSPFNNHDYAMLKSSPFSFAYTRDSFLFQLQLCWFTSVLLSRSNQPCSNGTRECMFLKYTSFSPSLDSHKNTYYIQESVPLRRCPSAFVQQSLILQIAMDILRLEIQLNRETGDLHDDGLLLKPRLKSPRSHFAPQT